MLDVVVHCHASTMYKKLMSPVEQRIRILDRSSCLLQSMRLILTAGVLSLEIIPPQVCSLSPIDNSMSGPHHFGISLLSARIISPFSQLIRFQMWLHMETVYLPTNRRISPSLIWSSCWITFSGNHHLDLNIE